MSKVFSHLRDPATSLWFLALLALALRLAVAALTSGADYDITSYHLQAQSVLTHQNVYAVTDRYPYPPVWVWLAGLAQWTANVTGLPFVWLVKLPGILGDGLIVALLRRYQGVGAALFYALNPVSIVITAGHGQFDGLVLACVVAAWALWQRQPQRQTAWAALALGGAIALKGYPILLLPALLIKAPTHKHRVVLVGLALTPLVVCVLIYTAFFGLEPVMVSRVLGYVSPAAFGWALYGNSLLGLWPNGANLLLPTLSLITRIIVLALPLFLIWRRPTWPLERQWLAVFLGFYALAPGVSAQYLLWALPLLALLDLRAGISYTGFAFVALFFFYLYKHPGAVPWGPAIASSRPFYVWLVGYWIADLAWWGVCLRLFLRIFRQTDQTPHQDQGPLAGGDDHSLAETPLNRRA